jgi:tRNA(Arg) A34 adenosine deaminase TadA
MPFYYEDDADAERDTIFSLLTVAAVAATWDDTPLGEGRGHNIGALLVDKKHRPVAFARNESTGRRDLTEHAELRLMRGHIADSPDRTELHKHAIYTTLEPCVMCAGMMLMTNIRRAVYALPDPMFGGVFDRLESGQTPYPKPIEHLPADRSVFHPLHLAFSESGAQETIEWLPTPSARGAFVECATIFQNYTPAHPENDVHLSNAHAFLSTRFTSDE